MTVATRGSMTLAIDMTAASSSELPGTLLKRTPDEGKATQDRCTGGPAAHTWRSKRSSNGPESVQIRVRGCCDRPFPPPAARSGNSRFDQVCTPFGPNLDRNCPRIIVIWVFKLVVLSR